MAVGVDVDERNRIIGDNLRKYRLLKGMTQDELAVGLCSVSQLSKIENGKTYLKRTMLKQMADRLGVPLERLESGDAILEELKELLQVSRDYHTARNIPKALEQLEQVIKLADDFGYLQVLVDAIHDKCFILLYENKAHAEVIKLAGHILSRELFQSVSQKMWTLLILGEAYDFSGDQQAAFDCYLRADQEYEFLERDGDHSKLLYKVLSGLTKFHSLMGNNRASLRYAEKAEREAISTNTHLFRIRAFYLKAIPLRLLGEEEKAEQIYLEALQEANGNSLLLDVAIISNNLGEIYQERGEFGRALEYFQRSYNVFSLMEAGLYLYMPLMHLAEVAFLHHEHDKCLDYLREIFQLCEQAGVSSYRERAGALRFLAKLKFEQGEVQSFEELMLEAVQIYHQHNVLDEAYEISVELAEYYSQTDSVRSVQLYKQAVEYNKTLKSMRR
ncbi:helix-turn-helix domain-containing protein [Tumebacillus flagellatus]|uniref:HTH cro/C1-type domain-containing protein n=1 Tax=Tumebacillus flagellatus TaxID=1157490 RepID=A0A074LRE5_9BACL|nr:helix-turn-helix transcriptional regulator [Tumebacillus flagellatus]KEO84696.1 hypothetical protein EL26_04035 [Tumebacillus flagellatus]